VDTRMSDARRRTHAAARALAAGAARLVDHRRHRLEHGAARLQALSPLATLARGYAVVRSPEGRAVVSVHQVAPDTPLDIVLRDGCIRAGVTTTRTGVPTDFLQSDPTS